MKYKTIKLTIYTYLFLGILFVSCKERTVEEKITNSPLIGTQEVWSDESLRNIVSQQEDVFELAYSHANINIQYASELSIKRKFYADSIDAMIISHGIDSADLKVFHKRKLYPLQYRFGKSAMVFVGAKGREQTKFTYEEMLEMLSNPNSGQVFGVESKDSGIALELTNHLKGKPLSKNVFGLTSKEEVINWVNRNPANIGILDLSNISDEDDPIAKETLAKVSVISIGQKDSKNKFYYEPFQENLNGLYPFTRDLYVIRRLRKTNVTLGFASFICEERGQKIMLKAGLLPEYQTERWIEFKGLTDINVVE